MNKFKLVWENNPDTALSAENLSKFVSFSTENNERILYVDDPLVYPNGDNELKIRANSRISFVEPITNAFFRFNNSIVSHDSRYSPIRSRSTSYRVEGAYHGSRSVSLDESSSNLINPTWTISTSGTSTSAPFSGNKPVDSDFFQINTDISGSLVTMNQLVSFTVNETVSISFYYRGDGFKLLIEGSPSNTPKFWREQLFTRAWEVNPYEYNVPSSAEWKRFELKNIPTSVLIQSEITIRLSFDGESKATMIGAFQFEELEYSSAYMHPTTIRESSQLVYKNDIFDPREGCFDATIKVDSFHNDNILFLAKASTSDSHRLYFDVAENRLVFRVYDTSVEEYKSIHVFANIENIVGKFIRVICCWKSNLGLSITLKVDSDIQHNTLNTSFTPYSLSNIDDFSVGGDYPGSISNNILRGLLNSLKIGFIYKSHQQITETLLLDPHPDNNTYKFFETGSESIFLDASFLDQGTIFDPNSQYYVWMCDDRITDTATIVISKDSLEPLGYRRYFSRVLGSFRTGSSAEVLGFTTWDVSTYYSNIVNTNKLTIGGLNTAPDIEFRRQPFGPSNDATFNVPTYYTDDIRSGTFMHVDKSGVFNFDNIRLDSSDIKTINANSDLNLLANGSGRIRLQTDTSYVLIDDIRIKNNKINPEPGKHLIIQNDETSSNIYINAFGGSVQIDGNIQLNSGTGNIMFDQIMIEANTIRNPSSNLVLTALSNITLTSGNQDIRLDNLRVKDNTLSNNTSNFNIQSSHDLNLNARNINVISDENILFSSGTGAFGLENIRIDQNKLFSQTGYDLVLETENSNNHVRLNSPGSGSVFINSVKFDQNKIYTDVGTHLELNSAAASSEVRLTGSRVRFQSANTSFDNGFTLTDSSINTFLVRGHNTQTGVLINSQSPLSASDPVLTLLNSGGNSQFRVTNGQGVIIGDSGQLEAGQSSPSGTQVLGYNGHFYATKVYNAVYNDLAECWEKEASVSIEYCQVVVREYASGVVPSTKRAQKNVVGVVSKDFGYLLGAEGFNEDLSKSSKVPIAISGRVKVYIRDRDIGKLKPGDELVSWKDGLATKANFFERVFKRAAIIGKVDVSMSNQAIIKV